MATGAGSPPLLVIVLCGIMAVLSTAVIFGTDFLTAAVLRPAFAELDDQALVQVAGRTHRFGDRRLPAVGITSVAASLATAGVSFAFGRAVPGVLAAAGLTLLLIWLALFARISAPINRVLIAAALAGDVPADARTLQDRWESIIVARAVLQGVALVLFCAAIGTVNV